MKFSLTFYPRITLSFFVFFTLLQVSVAQQMDTISMSTDIEVVNIIDAIGGEQASIVQGSSTYNGQSFIQNLDRTSGLTIRSGGPAILSTIMVRGMASRHVGILWSGFNIQSIVNGTYDASEIPTTFDKVSFLSSNSASIIGNAAVAGAIDLSNNIRFTKSQSSFGINYGSDQNLSLTSINRFARGKYRHTLGIELRNNENAYDFFIGKQKLTQRNAQYKLGDLNYQGKYAVNERLQLNGGAWLQKATRNIPSTKTSVTQIQTQEDVNYRASIGGSYFLNSDARLVFRSAHFKETLHFQSPGIDSKSKANIYNVAVDYINDIGLTVSPQFRYDFVEATFFEERKSRSTLSVLADYKNELYGYEYGVSFRPQLIDEDIVLGTSNLRLSKKYSSSFGLNANVGRGYTMPSFNDLYWPAGGNDQLEAETSNIAELGFDYNYKGAPDKYISTKIFYNDIKNWIQWIPIDGLWQPLNQRDVRNVGFEIEMGYQKLFSARNSIGAKVSFNFVDSRLKKHNFNPLFIGKKTIFVPAKKISATIDYNIEDWSIALLPLYYSKRYDTIDNSTSVPGYFTADVRVSKVFNPNYGNKLQIIISIENIGNNDFESIRFFPMPLRIFRIGLQFNLD